jgi:hypothetical protein
MPQVELAHICVLGGQSAMPPWQSQHPPKIESTQIKPSKHTYESAWLLEALSHGQDPGGYTIRGVGGGGGDGGGDCNVQQPSQTAPHPRAAVSR